jgi:hypothetical protein
VRVQVPDVLDAGHLFPQPVEDVGLKFVIIGAMAMSVFGVSARRSKVCDLEAIVPDGAEEGYGKFQPLELAREAHDLGIDAVLQNQGLLHSSNFSRN